MEWKPDITVAAVVARERRFLIVEERIAGKRVLNQPAGHVEDNESVIAAVIRETREETAWQFAPEALVGVYCWRKPDSQHDTLRFAITGQVSDHNALAALDQPIITTHWLTREELLHRQEQLRTPLVLRCIDDFLAGHCSALTGIADLRDLR
jgi:8-oxo-dGTP pyrophosphatase MutT (NUDIX family)